MGMRATHLQPRSEIPAPPPPWEPASSPEEPELHIEQEEMRHDNS
jgi:hypothetical protein